MAAVTATCKSCGAAITWAVSTTTGARIPLDADPVGPASALFYLDDESGIQVGGAETVYRNHFITCPSREQHRKPRPLGDAIADRAA